MLTVTDGPEGGSPAKEVGRLTGELHMKDPVGTAIGIAEWRALGAVVARREALVFAAGLEF